MPLADGPLVKQYLEQFVTKELFQCAGIVVWGDAEVASSLKAPSDMMMWQWGLKPRKSPKVWMEQAQPGMELPALSEVEVYSFRGSQAMRLNPAILNVTSFCSGPVVL